MIQNYLLYATIDLYNMNLNISLSIKSSIHPIF